MRLILLIISILTLTACAPSRHVSTSFAEVRDTTHIVVHDTVRVTQLRDSIVFHATASLRESETTTFDPQTGNPVQHHRELITDIGLSSLIQHIADSLYAAHVQSTETLHDVSASGQEEITKAEAALSSMQILARKVATIICVIFVIMAIILAIRIYLHRKDFPCI